MKRWTVLPLCVALIATCKVRMPDGAQVVEGSFPCETSDTCPAPDSACLLATCMDGQCVFVPAPNGVLPTEEQVAGDCKQVFCDGDGQAVTYAAQHDLPSDDNNPCTVERCDVDLVKRDNREKGAPCPLQGESVGLCNGAGKCGVCLPDAKRCDGHAVASCNGDGQWDPAVACAVDKPVCSNDACIGVVEIAAGGAHACARFDDGSVRCWGRMGTTVRDLASSTKPSWTSRFATIRSGASHACGIRSDSVVWCWGTGAYGQLGNGARRPQSGPVSTGVSATALALGRDHSCALAPDGTVRCWGANDRGQIGSGSNRSTTFRAAVSRVAMPIVAPTAIEGLQDAVSLELNGAGTCVTRKAGSVHCWGLPTIPPDEPPPADDADEPEVDPSTLKISVAKPTPVLGVKDAVELGCGDEHCCARHKAGTVSCWGAGADGRLGNGNNKDSFRAVPVASIKDAKRLGVGKRFACVLLDDDSVQCWGATTTKRIPAPVKSLSVGRDHACVLKATGSVTCWDADASPAKPVAWPSP